MSESSTAHAWPLRSEADIALWDRWSTALLAARHPSLARIGSVSRTEDTGTLTVLDADSESITAWAARTSADVPARLAILRAAAAALDALYAGDGSDPGIPHGGVSTSNVRVDADGATRLVGFSPWAGAVEDDARFLAPELNPGAPATRAADSFAFARVVAEVLGGAKVAEAEDADGVVRALRLAPDTRRRARLVKSIAAALTGPAETRPHPLSAWLANAVEGTAATEVRGREPAVATEHPGPDAPRRTPILAAVVGVALVVGLGGWALGRGDGQAARAGTPGPTGPVRSSSGWTAPCAGVEIAHKDKNLEELRRRTTAARLDDAVLETDGGRWYRGRVLISLRATSPDALIAVDDIHTTIYGEPDPPGWIAAATGRCASEPEPDFVFDYDVERDDLRPVGPTGTDGRFQANGQTRLSTTPTVYAVDATACRRNSAWKVVVHAFGPGVDKTIEFGPFYSYGRATDTRRYTVGGSRSVPRYMPGGDVSGPDPRC